MTVQFSRTATCPLSLLRLNVAVRLLVKFMKPHRLFRYLVSVLSVVLSLPLSRPMVLPHPPRPPASPPIEQVTSLRVALMFRTVATAFRAEVRCVLPSLVLHRPIVVPQVLLCRERLLLPQTPRSTPRWPARTPLRPLSTVSVLLKVLSRVRPTLPTRLRRLPRLLSYRWQVLRAPRSLLLNLVPSAAHLLLVVAMIPVRTLTPPPRPLTPPPDPLLIAVALLHRSVYSLHLLAVASVLLLHWLPTIRNSAVRPPFPSLVSAPLLPRQAVHVLSPRALAESPLVRTPLHRLPVTVIWLARLVTVRARSLAPPLIRVLMSDALFLASLYSVHLPLVVLTPVPPVPSPPAHLLISPLVLAPADPVALLFPGPPLAVGAGAAGALAGPPHRLLNYDTLLFRIALPIVSRPPFVLAANYPEFTLNPLALSLAFPNLPVNVASVPLFVAPVPLARSPSPLVVVLIIPFTVLMMARPALPRLPVAFRPTPLLHLHEILSGERTP